MFSSSSSSSRDNSFIEDDARPQATHLAGSHHPQRQPWCNRIQHVPRGLVECLNFDEIRMKTVTKTVKGRQNEDIAHFCINIFECEDNEFNGLLEGHVLSEFEAISVDYDLRE